MSELSEKIRKSLFEKLNVNAVTSLATGGVHYEDAPEGANYPIVLFQRYAPELAQYSLGGNLAFESDVWLVKALTDNKTSGNKSPHALAEEILAAILLAINETLNPDGADCLLARRVGDFPPMKEKLSDRNIYHHGFFLKVITS